MEPIPDLGDFSATISREGTLLRYRRGEVLFSQGDPADAVFLIQQGKVKLSVTYNPKKKAVLAILTAGDLVGETCLAGHAVRKATASTMTGCSVIRLAKPAMARLIREDHVFAGLLLSYALTRISRAEDDLADQLLSFSEKRLARTLLLLANFEDGVLAGVITGMTQETLAGLVGTTRPRVSSLMNKFRKLGLIDYNGGIEVRKALLSVVEPAKSEAEDPTGEP